MSKNTIEQAVHKERWFWFVHGYDLALMDAAKVCETIAAYTNVTDAERMSLQYAADVIRKKTKMDKDSPESKEVDAMLLAQCTCGGVAGHRACTTECGIFTGCGGFANSADKQLRSVAQGTINELLGTQIPAEPPAMPLDGGQVLRDRAQVLIGQALSYIQGMGGTAPMTEENLCLLRKAIDTPKVAICDKFKECPFCGSSNITEEPAERTVSRTFELYTIEAKYNVVANTCKDCKEGWLDYRAEETELLALVKMLHDEVHRLRGVIKTKDGLLDKYITSSRRA